METKQTSEISSFFGALPWLWGSRPRATERTAVDRPMHRPESLSLATRHRAAPLATFPSDGEAYKPRWG